MVKLQVDSKLHRFSVDLERRITYIRGDSGTGKSTLVDKYSNNYIEHLHLCIDMWYNYTINQKFSEVLYI